MEDEEQKEVKLKYFNQIILFLFLSTSIFFVQMIAKDIPKMTALLSGLNEKVKFAKLICIRK